MDASNPRLISEHLHFRIYQEDKINKSGILETHEYVSRKDGTRTIGLDENNNIVLNYEYRYEKEAYDWRVPGGRLDHDNEPVLEAAQREFRQEAGYVSANWQFLWTTSLDSTVRYQRHFFLATNLQWVGTERDSGEFGTETHLVPLEKANEMALNGDIEEEISALAIARLFHEIKSGKRNISELTSVF